MQDRYAGDVGDFGKCELVKHAMLPYQLADGRFHDILDEEDSFVEGTAAMMMHAAYPVR